MCLFLLETDCVTKEQGEFQEMKLSQKNYLVIQEPCLVTGPSLGIMLVAKRVVLLGWPTSCIE